MSEHTAAIQPATRAYRVDLGDELLFEIDQVLELTERYGDRESPVVLYFAADALGLELRTTSTSTHCPIKGDASYRAFGISKMLCGRTQPHAEVAVIGNHFGFDTSKGFRIE